MRILLGVAAGIAAYKSALLLRLFTEAGHDVRVVPTRASLEFVGRATWEALSGHPVTVDVFDDVPSVEHVKLGREAELVVVAPATADLLARAASGRCDDLLTAALLTVRCPVLVAPAMHTEMWLHPATQANVATLRARGIHVLEPAVGRLTGPDTGPGRLPDPEDIARAALALVAPQDLAGRHIVISAGGTREPIDPVRFLGNRSSGHQGYALARAAARRGAQVTVVAANVALPDPHGVEVRRVETTAELAEAVRAAAVTADVVVMAAAVADFRPDEPAATKIKKVGDGAPTIRLTQTEDVLAGLVATRRPGQVVVGFAAETGDADGDVQAHGAAKARRKGADLLVVNPVGVGVGFGDVPNEVTLLDAAGHVVATGAGAKDEVAELVLDQVVARLVRP
ncbi:bifunctional phosphopantothenoylcysteine decarboxylase/phosphopantothenate--cysteine ligase CoaBC [Actinotalea sp. M2MS4P-6]|uniref:bifunctional phosphopantothenoylcysteine decarboxylase/phosphopantothenate--cysteine ligase CoaBC n=1 Tax=Actinotalea sp. M2MS4P-6 TaxID=2983762 RepID=UPI0021E459A0|nr:bifunctional phosphopantothenoylcysteine decarboxylase/phosphopantothenate--cysteine ligase CoaBC [Actinotalea sp. M2MS4P-6]MCV2394600.1 bifunctional phosphopantothenoylcysteine decarboxylase/phosphopantothenate--cysteine ligase CoaBC [Actinotalea sp. M2MS4P-6]